MLSPPDIAASVDGTIGDSAVQVCLRPETTEPDPGEGAGEEGRERERETLYFPLPSS